MLISVENLEAGYDTSTGRQSVVKIGHLSIAQGEHTLLLGPSGSGKPPCSMYCRASLYRSAAK